MGQRAHDQCRNAAVTPPVGLSFSFLPHVSAQTFYLLYFIATDRISYGRF